MELLQQFYIKLADHSKTFKIWVGDLHKYCLYCTRCNRAITFPDYIEGIMEVAPIAMLWHFGLASGENQIHSPFVFPNQESMYYSCTQFEESWEKIDAKQPSPFKQYDASTNQGMIRFCEATKVVFQSSKLSNTDQTKTHDITVSNTACLLSSMFVDLIDIDTAIESGFGITRASMKESPIPVDGP